MNNKVTIGVGLAVVVVVGVVAAVLMNNEKDTSPAMKDKDSHMATSDNQSKNPSDAVQTTNNITYKGFAIVQKSIKVKKGTTVTWTNQDDAMHDVTPETETADFKTSKLFGRGETYQATFNTVGTYTYHCSPHPYMKGSIEVTE